MRAFDVLEQTWLAVAAEKITRTGNFVRRIPEISAVKVYAGLALPASCRILTFSVSKSDFGNSDLTEATKGYSVTIENITSEGVSSVSVLVREILGGTPLDLFTTLCSDLVEHVKACQTSKEVVENLRLRFHYWKYFFLNANLASFTKEKYIGLYGEMEFIERSLLFNSDPERLAKSWVGPFGANQDFHFGKAAVEVKATAVNDMDTIRVSNIRQLDDLGLDALFITHFVYDMRQGAGRTLVQLIDTIKQALITSPIATDEFTQRLDFIGYSIGVLGQLSEFGMTKRNMVYYRISDGFPRILESQLVNGISEVLYSVRLSAAKNFQCDEQDVMDLIPKNLNV